MILFEIKKVMITTDSAIYIFQIEAFIELAKTRQGHSDRIVDNQPQTSSPNPNPSHNPNPSPINHSPVSITSQPHHHYK